MESLKSWKENHNFSFAEGEGDSMGERRENYTAFGRGKKNPDETKDLTKGHLFLDSSF